MTAARMRGVSCRAGRASMSITPVLRTWPSRLVLAGVNQPKGRVAMWSPIRWSSVVSSSMAMSNPRRMPR